MLTSLSLAWLAVLSAVLLAVRYRLRRRLKRRWITLHRVLTVAILALMALHVSDVGIQPVNRLPAAVGYAETLTESNAADGPGNEAASTPVPVRAARRVVSPLPADSGTSFPGSSP